MDPQTVLIGIAIFVISALLIYFIAAVTMREKTFEEVMAEQKKRQEEEREKVKNDKKVEKELLKKKYKKGKGDKSKEKSAQATEPELKDSPKTTQKEHKMVNLELEAQIIEPSDSLVLSSSNVPRNRGTARKKSILHNKDEVTPVTDKAAELPHKPIKPLDDLELKKLHDQTHKKEKGGQHQAEFKQEVKESVKEVKVQKVRATRVETMEVQQGSSTVEEKKASKSKSAPAVESSSSLGGSRLVDAVRTASLNDREVQSLIEILLNRQGVTGVTPESWNKKSQKGDPIALMKKQLEEKERALQEEQQLAMSANNRVKELRNELTVERTKLASIEKHYQEKLAVQSADMEALEARLRQVHEQNMIESAKMQARLQQLEKSGDAAMIQKLKQENRILQETIAKASTESVPMSEVNNLRQKLSILEKELSNNASRINVAENAKKSLEDKLKKIESSKNGAGDNMAKKFDEVKAELKKSEAKNASLSADLKKATGAAEAECAALKTKLQELEKHLSASDANKEMGAKLQETERKKQELESNVKNLEKQLADAARRQDDTAKGFQETERKKQEMESNIKNLEKQLAEAVRRQEETAKELQQLRQENLTLNQEVKVTKEKQQTVAAAPPAPNGDIHGDAKNVIAVTEHERILSEKVAELAKLQSELEVQRSTSSQLTELKTQLDAQKQKNNELREKNWKAMEALEKAEKSAAEKVDKSLKSSRENVTKAVSEMEQMDREALKRLFPSVTVSDKLAHKEWLASFEKQAAQHIAQSASAGKSVSEKISHLQDENSHLQADLEVFKNNIAILHSEKDRVHQLEEENRKLSHQAESYAKEFTQHNADTEKLIHLEEENKRLRKSSSENASLSQDASRLQAENKELQSKLADKETNIKEAERKLHNLEQVVETEEKKWKEKLRQAEESGGQQLSSDSGREQELEELTIQQQSQIEHYRRVLADTEGILRRLETEEKKSEEKQNSSQIELQQARAECQRLKTDLQAITGSTEMQGKVDNLETELRQSTEKLHLLTREKEQLTSKVIVLETQSKAVVQVDNEQVRKELLELQRLMEVERKKNKELSSTLVRLNGIIKTGQDALSQEQKLVKQLQEQLTEKTKGTGATASQEIEQLKAKLSEKAKQLEREIAANKQLSQRLGQLGVLSHQDH
ncbi:ribosome-binding protein 1-like isoform X3 [Littorina saxatilis]|uniref:ribosome-binding protein 1-like isoform X3 n=1 Tax=Littorina saxatilis TaxID=31220 RepID=UPI0038B5AD5E